MLNNRKRYNVIIHKPSDEKVQQLFANAWANQVIRQINKLPVDQREAAYEAILKAAKEEDMKKTRLREQKDK